MCPEQRIALTPTTGTEILGTENGVHATDRLCKSAMKRQKLKK